MDFVRSSKSDKITLLLTTTQQPRRICLLSVYQPLAGMRRGGSCRAVRQKDM